MLELRELENHNHTKSLEILDIMFETALYESEKNKIDVSIVELYDMFRDLNLILKNILFGNLFYQQNIIDKMIETNYNYSDLMQQMYNIFLLYVAKNGTHCKEVNEAYQLKKKFENLFIFIKKNHFLKYPKSKSNDIRSKKA